MFKYGNLLIGGTETIIIAEAGVNHLKDYKLAERHIMEAAKAGVQIIKFQTYDTDKLTTKTAPRFWQWDGEHDQAGSQYDSYKILATPEADFTQFLMDTCNKYEIEFMSTPFDLDSLSMLDEIGSHGFKVASGDLTNVPLLRAIAGTNKPVFLSTGASTIAEICNAVNILEKSGARDICIMHCTLCYPTRAEHANLSALVDIKSNFPNYVIGLSDHTIGKLIPTLSVMLGAQVIEKHFTVDNNLPDSADHWLSINPEEITELMFDLKIAERAKGNGLKDVLACEAITRSNARRSIIVKGSIKSGEKFKENNLTTKRPGTGISALYWDDIIGLTATRDLSDDEMIRADDVLEDASFKPITDKLLKLQKGI
jgi:N,N'-diacetyllegionaminate synthase